jgi:dienelactone hydrolase
LVSVAILTALVPVSASVAETKVSFISEDLGYPAYVKREVPALQFKPDGPGPFPAVVLLHTCGGLQSHVTRDWPNYLVDLGYVVLTVDTFSAHGHRCESLSRTKVEEKEQAQEQDAFGALQYLAGLDFVDSGKVAAMGFSQGAIVINQKIMFRNPRPSGMLQFKAAISVYGSCRNMTGREGYPSPAIPLLQIVAEHDVGLNKSCLRVAGLVNDTEPVGPTGRTPTEIIDNNDKSGDGKLAASEWRGPKPVFVRADSNADGFITKIELNAFYVMVSGGAQKPAPNSMEVLLLKGAYHAFDSRDKRSVKYDPFGNKMLYSKDATNEARDGAKKFLATIFANGAS